MKRAAGEPEGKRLWLSMLAPGAAWFIQLVGTYVLVPWTCAMGGRAFILGGSAFLAAVAIAFGWISWSRWRRLDRTTRDGLLQNMEGDRVSFMVFGGLLSSGLFLLAIILGTIPVFFVDPCSPAPTI